MVYKKHNFLWLIGVPYLRYVYIYIWWMKKNSIKKISNQKLFFSFCRDKKNEKKLNKKDLVLIKR